MHRWNYADIIGEKHYMKRAKSLVTPNKQKDAIATQHNHFVAGTPTAQF